MSAFAGGLAGGVVGGLGHNMLGLETFGEGFAVGFGLGVSGYNANYDAFNPKSEQQLLASAINKGKNI